MVTKLGGIMVWPWKSPKAMWWPLK
jgi:hypothetical protein